MALTTNQKRLLEEAVMDKFNNDQDDVIAFMVDLIDRPEVQIMSRLKQFAARRKTEEATRLANYDASRQGIVDLIAFYDGESQ